MDNSLLTEHVLNLIPQEEPEHVKPPRYLSKFRTVVKTECKNGRSTHKTMGEEHAKVHTPNSFQRAHQEKISPAHLARESSSNDDVPLHLREKKKEPVPRRDERPVMGLKSTKDFIKQNVVDTKMQVPKKPAKKFVDTRNGAVHPLTPSGLEPLYLKKRDFGSVPEYLERRKSEMKAAQEEYDAYVEEMYRKGQMKQLSHEEREEILSGLKANWAELNKQYQSLSVTIDTVPKKMRKEKLEADMKDLEREIDLIERHKIIYVAN